RVVQIVAGGNVGHRVAVTVRERSPHSTVDIADVGSSSITETIGEQHGSVPLAGQGYWRPGIGTSELLACSTYRLTVGCTSVCRQCDHRIVKGNAIRRNGHIAHRYTLICIRSRAVIARVAIDLKIPNPHVVNSRH